jgi:hypothetical protein
MSDFYLDSHKLQEALLEAKKCPICQIVEDSISWHLESFLSEHVNDVKIRALWREAGGLCPQHTSLLEDSGPPLPRAILYHDLIKSLLPTPPKGRWRKKKQRPPCPVCQQVAQIEDGYLGLLADGLPRGNFRELVGSWAFCLPHWKRFLALSRPGVAQEFFQQTQLTKVERLLGDLSEFIRKHDWRYQDEALLPREGESPHLGASFLAGSLWLGTRGWEDV